MRPGLRRPSRPADTDAHSSYNAQRDLPHRGRWQQAPDPRCARDSPPRVRAYVEVAQGLQDLDLDAQSQQPATVRTSPLESDAHRADTHIPNRASYISPSVAFQASFPRSLTTFDPLTSPPLPLPPMNSTRWLHALLGRQRKHDQRVPGPSHSSEPRIPCIPELPRRGRSLNTVPADTLRAAIWTRNRRSRRQDSSRARRQHPADPSTYCRRLRCVHGHGHDEGAQATAGAATGSEFV